MRAKKIIIFAACAAVLGSSLSGCSLPSSEEVNEELEARLSEDTEEEEISVTLLSNDYIELTYTGCVKDGMCFTVTNKSGGSMLLMFESLKLKDDKYEIEDDGTEVGAGETVTFTQKIENFTKRQSQKISGTLNYYAGIGSGDEAVYEEWKIDTKNGSKKIADTENTNTE